MGLLDLIFPKYCVNCRKIGSYICPNCFAYLSFDVNPACVVCNRASIDGLTHPVCRGKYTIDGVFSSIVYKGIAKKLIYNFKYKPYLTDLKTVMSDLFYEGLIQNESFNKALNSSNSILVPIPLFKTKLKSRGYNQAEILSIELGKRLDPSHVLRMTTENVLERVINTDSQFKLKKEERKENIKGAFKISNKYQFQMSNFKSISVFLVDDVLTTGSTLMEAANILKRNGVEKVWGLTLAKD